MGRARDIPTLHSLRPYVGIFACFRKPGLTQIQFRNQAIFGLGPRDHTLRFLTSSRLTGSFSEFTASGLPE